MSTVNMNDLRVQKTLDAIRGSFESMLLAIPYSKITVTALCERARINKKTFYRYYQALDDLLEEIENQFIVSYVERTAGLRYPHDVERITREFLQFSAEQGPLYDAILCSSSHERLLTIIMSGMEAERYAYSNPPEGWSAEDWNLYMASVTSMQWSLYKQWVEDGRTVPVERMIDIACTIICKGGNLK